MNKVLRPMNRQYLLGFDIGGTHARSSLIQKKGRELTIIASQKHAIRANRSPQDIAALVQHILLSIVHEPRLSPSDISGIGVAIAGQIASDERNILNAPNLNWHHIDFYALLRSALAQDAPDLRIRIANDLNAIAWGEYHFGAAQNISSLLAVYVGTGIGAGLIIDGQLMLGAENVSGEIGHSKFPHLESYPCGCGQHGCIEAFAGGKAIEYRILHDIRQGRVTRQALGLEVDEHPTAKAIEVAYKQELAYAVAFWEEEALYLGALVANAIALNNPHGLLLGGGVLMGCPSLMALTVDHIMTMAPKAATMNLQLIKPTLHDDAGTLGAALLCADLA